MTVKGGFFNSVNGDRLYNAEDMNQPYKNLISNGVIPNPPTALKVSAVSGLTVNIADGVGLFGDKWAELTGTNTLTLDTAHAILNRIDLVVVRVDLNNSVRAITLDIVTGSPASSPVAPTLQRTDYIMEYALAKIYVAAGVESITASNITDTREDSALCGYATTLINNSNYASQVITIATSDWTTSESGYICSKTATGVTAANNILIGAVPASIADYTYNGVYCSDQTINTLTFKAVSKPTASIKINVMIL